MPQDEKKAPENKERSSKDHSSISSCQEPSPWIKTPASIRRLFDKFPLKTYPSNELPQRATFNHSQNNLYVFNTDEAAESGAPSFNPSCLKWQAYLHFAGVRHITITSNNHASPTGALPFLLPASPGPSEKSPLLIVSSKLQRWVLEKSGSHEKSTNMRYEAYMSLLDNPIRKAWLFALYLTPVNFEAIANPRYIKPTCNNLFVRSTLSYQLRRAAATELLKQSAVIDVESLYRDADMAWEALSELLGEDSYFFSVDSPGLFDASVFAYTHLLLSESMPWKDRRLAISLMRYSNLVDHSERIFERYFNVTQPA